jgi:hypothetical protein
MRSIGCQICVRLGGRISQANSQTEMLAAQFESCGHHSYPPQEEDYLERFASIEEITPMKQKGRELTLNGASCKSIHTRHPMMISFHARFWTVIRSSVSVFRSKVFEIILLSIMNHDSGVFDPSRLQDFRVDCTPFFFSSSVKFCLVFPAPVKTVGDGTTLLCIAVPIHERSLDDLKSPRTHS